MIPTVGAHVQIGSLDPVFAARLESFLADPAFGGTLKVYSGVRTYAQQRHLYDGWIRGRPGFNLAANPDRAITSLYGLPAAQGSWHMEQAGRGFAVDLNFSSWMWLHFGWDPGSGMRRREACDYIEEIAQRYLLTRTVPSEEWHYQMTYQDWWTLPAAAEEDDMPTTEEIVEALRPIIREATADAVRPMLGPQSQTRRLLLATLEASAGIEIPEPVAGQEIDLDDLAARIRAATRTGAVVASLIEIKAELDAIIDHLGVDVGPGS